MPQVAGSRGKRLRRRVSRGRRGQRRIGEPITAAWTRSAPRPCLAPQDGCGGKADGVEEDGFGGIRWSGRRDLNPGPLAPQASALARLRHGPNRRVEALKRLSQCNTVVGGGWSRRFGARVDRSGQDNAAGALEGSPRAAAPRVRLPAPGRVDAGAPEDGADRDGRSATGRRGMHRPGRRLPKPGLRGVNG